MGPVTAMLRALVAPMVSQWTITERIKKLKRYPNRLIEQPWQQRAAVNANYNHLVVTLSAPGLALLIERGRITRQQADWYRGINENRNTYEHDAMAAYLSASIDLGCRQDENLHFVSWLEIFSGEACPDATKAQRNPLLIPYEIDRVERALIPDALCGVAHRDNGVNYYAIEADRNTEPIDSPRLKRSSYARHLAGYRHVLRRELYATQYGVPNMQVLTITVSETHMLNIMSHLRRVAAERVPHLSGPRPFLFKAVPSLGRRINKPPVTGHILTTAFSRIDDDYVRIDQ